MEMILALVTVLLAAAVIYLVIKLGKRQEEIGALRSDRARLEERLKIIDSESIERQRASEERFTLLANRIMQSNSQTLRRESEERIGQLLTPLREDIVRFKKSIDESYSAEARERFSLGERIKELIAANQSIGREARELADALRGNSKVQGDWGEMILQTILEKSGLVEGTHYKTQQTTDDSGRTLRNDRGAALRPDVVIYYPGERCMVVDSKVSLTAFVDMVNAEDESVRKESLRKHIGSVRGHILELAKKNYQDYVGENKADFVMMFIPNEAAYIEAMKAEPNLWQEAYDRRVLIVSPTHLISALKLIAQLWQQNAQAKNAVEIATAAGRMYDKFVAFTDDMAQIKKGIQTTEKAFSEAMNKLSDGKGNLVSRAEKLRELGAKATKQLAKDAEKS